MKFPKLYSRGLRAIPFQVFGRGMKWKPKMKMLQGRSVEKNVGGGGGSRPKNILRMVGGGAGNKKNVRENFHSASPLGIFNGIALKCQIAKDTSNNAKWWPYSIWIYWEYAGWCPVKANNFLNPVALIWVDSIVSQWPCVVFFFFTRLLFKGVEINEQT